MNVKRGARLLAMLIVVLTLMQNGSFAAEYKDVGKNKSYASAVGFVSSAGLMVGYGDGTFRPENPVTRAEMATVMCKLLKQDANLKKDGKKFSDVPGSHWGNAYVVKAASLGILSGYGNGKFGPDDTVTYEQALTMMVNAMQFGSSAGKLGGYPDGYVKVAENLGLTANVTSKVGAKLTRGNVAVLLLNYYDNSIPVTDYLGRDIDSLISDLGYEYSQAGGYGSRGRYYKNIETHFLYGAGGSDDKKITGLLCYGDRNYYKGLSAQMTYPELVAILPGGIKVEKPEKYYNAFEEEDVYSVSFEMNGYSIVYTWDKDPNKAESVELIISRAD